MEFAEVLTGMEAGELWQRLRDHANDSIAARCIRCGTSRCASYRKARAQLVRHGLLDEDAVR